jgi:aminoglycoside phosphotransferase (APT) family kinase protein
VVRSAGGIDAASVERWLRARLPAGSDVTVRGIEQFARGVSRETWVVRLAGAGLPDAIVIRRDLPGGSLVDIPLHTEYEIYRRVGATKVPVARTLWFEDNTADLIPGPPFYAREFVAGSHEIPNFTNPDPAYDDLRIEVSKEHLRKLALVHTCDWRAAGLDAVLPAPSSADDCARHALGLAAARFDALRLTSYPEMTAGIQWLRRNAGFPAPRVCLVKGNNGLGEEVWRGTEIVAMSDWELASIGDPAYDFAQLQDLVPVVGPAGSPRWGLGPALGYYEQLTGIRIERRSLHFYRTLYAIEKACTALSAIRAIADGKRMARLAWGGTEVLYRARRTLAEAAGLVPGEADPYADQSLMPSSV